jgi:outer membrane protein
MGTVELSSPACFAPVDQEKPKEYRMQVSRSIQFSPLMASVVASFLWMGPLAGQSVTGPLSLADALDLASRNNGDFQTQTNQIRSAEWGVRTAYGSFVPSLSINSGFGYTATGKRRVESVVIGEQPAQYSSRYNLGMSLSLDGSTILAPSVARAQVRAAERQVEGSAANLRSDVTQRYLSVLEARDAAAQAERELERTEAHVQLAAARFQIGAGTQLDVSRAEVQRGQAEVRVVQSRNTADNEVLLLSQSIGMLLPVDIELTEQFELFEPMWTAEELKAIAFGGNPALLASREQANAAVTRAHAARSSYLPTLSLSAGVSGFASQAAADGVPFDYERQPANASLSISLPVFNGFRREQQIQEANIARLNAQHQVRTQELRVEVEIESALRNLETAFQTALLQQRVREMAEEELRLAEERFRFGATTSVEVVDAQASLAEAERAEIAAVFAFHRSLAILEARAGRPLQD